MTTKWIIYVKKIFNLKIKGLRVCECIYFQKFFFIFNLKKLFKFLMLEKIKDLI